MKSAAMAKRHKRQRKWRQQNNGIKCENRNGGNDKQHQSVAGESMASCGINNGGEINGKSSSDRNRRASMKNMAGVMAHRQAGGAGVAAWRAAAAPEKWRKT